MRQKKIAVDFDKTLHLYSKGYADGELYDPPIEGAKSAMQILKQKGYYIVIFSVRNISHVDDHSGKLESGQAPELERWLNKYGIPFDEIWIDSGKPQVDLFVDDKGYRFEGIWPKAVLDIIDILD